MLYNSLFQGQVKENIQSIMGPITSKKGKPWCNHEVFEG